MFTNIHLFPKYSATLQTKQVFKILCIFSHIRLELTKLFPLLKINSVTQSLNKQKKLYYLIGMPYKLLTCQWGIISRYNIILKMLTCLILLL